MPDVLERIGEIRLTAPLTASTVLLKLDDYGWLCDSLKTAVVALRYLRAVEVSWDKTADKALAEIEGKGGA